MAGAVIVGAAALISTGSVAFAIGAAIVSFAMSELAKPDIPSIDDFESETPTGHLRNTRDSSRCIPVVYGKMKVGGVQVFVGTSGENNKYLHIVQTLSEGKTGGVVNVFLNDKNITEYGTKAQYTFYNGSNTQTVDAQLKSIFPEWNDAMRYTSYIYVRLEYDKDLFTGMPDLTVEMNGVIIKDIRDNTYKVSDNPVLCLYDFLVNTRYGVGISESFIDLDSFIDAANWCDSKGYTFNAPISQRRAAIDVITNMLASFKGAMIFSDGRFKLLPLQYDAPVLTLKKSDIVSGSFKETLPSVQDLPNTLRVKWINPQNGYIYEDLIIYNSEQVAIDGEIIEKELLLYGCTSQKQARSMGAYYLERMRLNKKYSFLANLRVMPLEAGDMIVLQLDDYGVNEQVRIESITPHGSGAFEVVCVEENPNMYNDKTDLVDHTNFNAGLPSGLEKPAAPSGLSLTTGLESNTAGLMTAYIIATWNRSTNPHVAEYELKIRESGSLQYSYAKVSYDTTVYKFSGLKLNTTYYVAIRAIGDNGIVSDWSIEISITTAYDDVAPAAPTGLVLDVNFKTIYARWSENSEPDLAGYKVYAYQDEADFTCAEDILVWRGRANHCAFPVNNTGTWYVKVLAYDMSGNESECSTYASIDVSNPVIDETPEGYNLLVNSDFEDGLKGWELMAGCEAEIVTAENPKSGTKAAQNTCTDDQCWYDSKTYIPVQIEKSYLAEAYIKKISGTNVTSYIGVDVYDADKNLIDSILLEIHPGDTFAYHEIVFGYNTQNPFPANTAYMRATFTLNDSRDGTAQIQGVRIREIIESVYIHDGAITHAKIADLAVDDEKVNRLSGNKIRAGVITDLYGTETNYKFKIDLNQGEIRIRNGVAATNDIVNGNFENGDDGWDISDGEVAQNTDTSQNFDYFLKLHVTNGTDQYAKNTGWHDLASNDTVTIGSKLSIDTSFSEDKYPPLDIRLNIYDSDNNLLGYEVVDTLERDGYLKWTSYDTSYSVDTSNYSGAKWAELEFRTLGSKGGFSGDQVIDNPNFDNAGNGWVVSDPDNIDFVDCQSVSPQYWACYSGGYNAKMLVDGTSRKLTYDTMTDISAYAGKRISCAVDIYCDNPSDSAAVIVGVEFYDSDQSYIDAYDVYAVSPDSWSHYEHEEGDVSIPSNAAYAKVYAKTKAISGSSFYAYLGWLDLQLGTDADGYWQIANVSMKSGESGGAEGGTREVVMTNGDIVFYKYNDDGTVESFKSLRKIDDGIVSSGDWVNLHGFYGRQPEIILSPSYMKYYDHTRSDLDQYVSLAVRNLSGDRDTGEWSFQANVELTLGTDHQSYSDTFSWNGGCDLYFYDQPCDDGRVAMVATLDGSLTIPSGGTKFSLNTKIQFACLSRGNTNNQIRWIRDTMCWINILVNGSSVSGWLNVGTINYKQDGMYKTFQYNTSQYDCNEGDVVTLQISVTDTDPMNEYHEEGWLPDGYCTSHTEHDSGTECDTATKNFFMWAKVESDSETVQIGGDTTLATGDIYWIAIG